MGPCGATNNVGNSDLLNPCTIGNETSVCVDTVRGQSFPGVDFDQVPIIYMIIIQLLLQLSKPRHLKEIEQFNPDSWFLTCKVENVLKSSFEGLWK